MAKKEKALDPFDIINSELSGNASQPFAQNNGPSAPSPNVPPNRAAPSSVSSTEPNVLQSNSPISVSNGMTPHLIPEQRSNDDVQETEDEAEDAGCIGYIAKGALILFLAAVLAWIIFMPSGSLSELKDHVLGNLFGTSTSDNAHDFVVNSTTVNTTTTIDTASTTETTEPTEQSALTEVTTTTAVAAAGSVAATTTTAAATTGAVTTTTSAKKTTATTAEVEETIVLNDAAAQNTATYADGCYIYVYLKSQIVVVYDDDDEVQIAFTCSSGKASTPTKTGDYRILTKYRWRLMIGNCYTQYASSFSSGYLFHSIPYNKKNAATMSNTSYDKLGSPASAGCVRLCFRDAKWVYDNCPVGTYVKVTDDYAPTGIVTQTILPRINDTAHSGWDPTDTDPNNPYYD